MKINLIKQYGNLLPYSQEDKKKIDEFKDGAIYIVEINNSDKRTLQQNKSIHKWCEQIASELNKEKFFIQDVIKLNTKWNMLKVKELIFKPVVQSLYTKDSTTKLNKDEFELIIDTIIRALGTKGIECPDFPNTEDLENITYKKRISNGIK